MRIRLRNKIIGLAVFSAMIPVLALSLMIVSQQENVVKRFDRDLDVMVDKDLTNTVKDFNLLCSAVNELVEREVNTNLRVAVRVIHDKGHIHLSEHNYAWRTENEWSQEHEDMELPEIIIGGTGLGKNYNGLIPTHVVDEVQSLVGGTVSIFQKINERGDMMRVATTLRRPDGSRHIGQYLPANDIIHDPDQTITRVLSGETVYSKVYFYDQWFIFAATPLRESSTGRVIGMVRTALDQNSLRPVKKSLEEASLGQDGFIWVMQGSNKASRDRNNFIYPREVDQDYSKLNQLIHEKGYAYFDTLKGNVVPDRSEHIFTDRYLPRGMEEDTMNYSIIKYMYFEPWDWVIGISASETDFVQIHDQLREPFSGLMRGTLWTGLVGVILVITIAFFLGGVISQPITDLTKVALRVADGDLRGAAHLFQAMFEKRNISEDKVSNGDETGQLYDAFRRMISHLNSLIGHVKQATNHLIVSANELSNTSTVQEQVAKNFRDSTSQIAGAIDNISNTSQTLFSTMINVSDVAQETGVMAGEGRTKIKEMEGSMQVLGQSTASISAKLTVIKQKAANINTIITTISKVSDQTNLLSVNASIEAEKAGEYGQGFAVVAREIGRLADQAGLATSDIEQMVREMHAAISTGALEMDHFIKEVSAIVQEVDRVSGQFSTIIEHAEDLSPRFEIVKNGMDSQSQGAQEINQAVIALAGVADQSAQSLSHFESAQGSLNSAIDGLSSEVARFQVKELTNV